jgi:hypothetical protein
MFRMKYASEQSRQVAYGEDVIQRLATDAIWGGWLVVQLSHY